MPKTYKTSVGGMGSSAAVPEILSGIVKLLEDEDWVVRWAAARAARSMGSSVAVPEFLDRITKLLEDEVENVREAAAEALGELGWKPARDENAAWYWIAKQGWKKCVALGDVAVEPLISVLRDKDRFVRKAVEEALVALYRSGRIRRDSKEKIRKNFQDFGLGAL